MGCGASCLAECCCESEVITIKPITMNTKKSAKKSIAAKSTDFRAKHIDKIRSVLKDLDQEMEETLTIKGKSPLEKSKQISRLNEFKSEVKELIDEVFNIEEEEEQY
jgi:uncharacterized protein YaaR (DUF327 family)